MGKLGNFFKKMIHPKDGERQDSDSSRSPNPPIQQSQTQELPRPSNPVEAPSGYPRSQPLAQPQTDLSSPNTQGQPRDNRSRPHESSPINRNPMAQPMGRDHNQHRLLPLQQEQQPQYYQNPQAGIDPSFRNIGTTGSAYEGHRNQGAPQTQQPALSREQQVRGNPYTGNRDITPMANESSRSPEDPTSLRSKAENPTGQPRKEDGN